LTAALRGLQAIDAVGIAEAHGPSLQLFVHHFDWKVQVTEHHKNLAGQGQKTFGISFRSRFGGFEPIEQRRWRCLPIRLHALYRSVPLLSHRFAGRFSRWLQPEKKRGPGREWE